MSLIKDKINSENLPKHVAIINAVRNAINACNEINIPYLTLYTFSSENWSRPTEEVNTLMNLLVETLLLEAEEIFSKGLRMHVIGNLEKLPALVKEQLERVVELTKENTKGNLVLAISYGSQNEILEAVKNISSDVKEGKVEVENINESLFENYLYTKDFPPVDLLIRTSGEIRISNFLLWQIAYAELQFLNVLWPDFTKDIFFQCIVDYQNKERRYGLTGEQVKGQ